MSAIFGYGIEFGRAYAESRDKHDVPVAYSLASVPLGDEKTCDNWSYALRQTDGYAVVIGYYGDVAPTEVPAVLNGHEVVGLAKGALATQVLTRIELPGNLLYIEDGVFGDQSPVITAPNGSYAIYYASQSGMRWETCGDYQLVPGVIDYSYASRDNVVRRSSDLVWFRELEGARLHPGSIFHMEDARSSAYFYQVDSIVKMDDGVLATVHEPDISEAVVEAHIQETIILTTDDFTPAEGVTVEKQRTSRAATTTTEDKSLPKIFIEPSMNTFTGVHTSEKISVCGSVEFSASTTYTLDVVGGEVISASSQENCTVKASVTITDSGMVSSKANKAQEPSDHFQFAIQLGKLTFGTGVICVEISPALTASLSGALTAEFTHTSTTKKVYDPRTETWEVQKDNGNAKAQKNGFNVTGSITGKIGVKIGITVLFFQIVRCVEVDVEGGISITFNATLYTTDTNIVPCATVTIDVFITSQPTPAYGQRAKRSFLMAPQGSRLARRSRYLRRRYLALSCCRRIRWCSTFFRCQICLGLTIRERLFIYLRIVRMKTD